MQTDAYCLCGEGEYGLMLYCDVENCPVGWYHAECVGLTEESVGTAQNAAKVKPLRMRVVVAPPRSNMSITTVFLLHCVISTMK